MLDWIILIVLGMGTIGGFIKGFIRQLASLVGLVAGLLVARALFGVVGERLAVEVGTSATFGQILAFLLIWIIVPLGISLIASILTRIVEMVKLGFVNRWLGAGMGLIKYALLISMFIHLIEFIDTENTLIRLETKQQSSLYYPMERFSSVFAPAFKAVADTVTEQL